MNYYFITGTGRGIGKALAELLLQSENNFVYGLSRSNEIANKNFKHLKTDLNETDKVKLFEFPGLENAESIVLVNNSFSKMEILHMGKRTSENIIENYNVNIISPSLLINNFLKKYQSYENCKRIIINISSGAATTPIEAWSTYCASKSALAMMSEVINVEQKLKHPENPVHIFSFSPGVVDTDAQKEIRKASPEDFSMVGEFIKFHANNQLSSPESIAEKIYRVMQSPEKFEQILVKASEM
ncbi:MAG TPA: SDR family NAD(P)-dependent oxidoreductase [Ignavibacteria bacterium]|nr:SDR family NAD(P)-dependent oxidoreductase [Ignavibacteria bacterium]